jgi:hypothetical protein
MCRKAGIAQNLVFGMVVIFPTMTCTPLALMTKPLYGEPFEESFAPNNLALTNEPFETNSVAR